MTEQTTEDTIHVHYGTSQKMCFLRCFKRA